MPCTNHADVVSPLVDCARCGKPFCQDCVVEIGGLPYDAACKDEALRDLKSGTADTELATAGRRFGGIFIDGLVFSPIAIWLMFQYPGAGLFDHWAMRSLMPAVLWVVYETLMLLNGGQTLGKKAVNTKVVNPDGSPLTSRQVLIRAVTRQVGSLTYLIGMIDALMVFSDRRRTLHDRLGGTLVVNWKG